MRKVRDTKGVYAQSSDIKSRSYLKYREDMKKKAIAEFEIKEWFENKLKELYKTDEVIVKKSGGDAHLWFTRDGKVSGEVDYKAFIGREEKNFEFQYSDRLDLSHFDFKVSKVGNKKGGVRIPHRDRSFLYIIKPSNQFAILTPEWVMENGEEAGVPAWGNRTAFRVPKETFMKRFQKDEDLEQIIKTIDKKNQLLEIQSKFVERESKKLSSDLQQVVDKEKIFQVMPKTLEGFYTSCFFVDKVDDYPENYSLWLVYATSLYSGNLNSYEFAQLLYCLDFLYGGTSKLQANEIEVLVATIKKCSDHIKTMQKDGLQTSKQISPFEETVNFLFAVNLYEDISQELRHLYKIDDLVPVDKIFQSVDNIDSVLVGCGYG